MEDDNGDSIKLQDKWVLWCHSMTSDDWSIDGFNNLFTIKTVSDFWSIVNNLENIGLNCMHLFIMREGITPTWEDTQNRNGGVCSFKVDYNTSVPIIENITSYMVLDQLIKDDTLNEINGIVISPKINARNNWLIVKIWNKHNTSDISKLLNDDIKCMCKNISIQYKSHKPEF